MLVTARTVERFVLCTTVAALAQADAEASPLQQPQEVALISRAPLPGVSSQQSVAAAEATAAEKLDLDVLKPRTRVGLGRPVYSVDQLVKFLILRLVTQHVPGSGLMNRENKVSR